MNKNLFHIVALVILLMINTAKAQNKDLHSVNSINLAGTWQFKIDSTDVGEAEQWYSKKLDGNITLPGSMTTNNIGNDINVNTPWTGGIVDSSWFFEPQYAKYRQPGNVKVPFWLQPTKYYKGAAWYQKEIIIPASWNEKHITLFLERCHWETTVWVDDTKVGSQNALGTPYVYDLTSLSPGKHHISICVDNRIKDVNVGINSHSISDHTQTNWNGITGKIYLEVQPQLYINDVQLFPDIQKKEVVAVISYKNLTNTNTNAQLKLLVSSENAKAEKLKALSQEQAINNDNGTITITYSMGNQPLLWDEFHPNLYNMQIAIESNGMVDEKNIAFGMRSFTSTDSQLLINNRPIFLRGTLECAMFPLTGFPSTEASYWKHIFSVCKSYGLNHIRFHSWCPPEIAFAEADSAGFYLQVECSSWANQGAVIGDGTPLDTFIYDESKRIVQAFGNHPSFCMMAYGNEPAGKNHIAYLTKFVEYWKQKDTRHLYTTAAGWPVVDESDYNSTPDPRIQAWGAGLKSIINSKPPQTGYDWSDIISKWKHPTVSHEIGQWCVYPDFKEISQYTGVLKAKNFEIFRETLQEYGMKDLADSFLIASGKLQVLCYKADIEAALRTKNFGGFQLLGVNDFPGQGTALVGVLNAFWKDKGYVTGKEYSRFCNAVVPLARFPKMVYLNNEDLIVPVEIANFGEAPLQNVKAAWTIKDVSGKIIFNGELPPITVPIGNAFKLGDIRSSLASLQNPSKLILSVTVAGYENAWDFFVYPAKNAETDKNIFVTQQFNAETIKKLNEGAKVLLTLKKGSVKKEKGGDIAIGFSSIFWNTAWTHSQPPTTLGLLCNPDHPAFKYFPTDYHSNWQWWDAMSHSNAIILDSISKNLKPIVRVIDDWVTARPLGLVFECYVGKGKLIVSSIDLLNDADKRPEAKQLLYSLQKYMESSEFKPDINLDASKIKDLLTE